MGTRAGKGASGGVGTGGNQIEQKVMRLLNSMQVVS